MANFFIHAYPKRKKLDVAYQYFLIVFTLLGISSLVYFGWEGGWRKAGNLVLLFFLLWSAIDRLWRKKKEHFIDINEDRFEWLVSEHEQKISVQWHDIRWIKKEIDGGITLFQESSFSKHFSLIGFSEEDTTGIYQLIQQIAIQKEIRMVNFLETASAVA